jgi:Family of unknown function (DUF6283)
MEESVEYRQRPCVDCPWRTDADLDKFSDQDFAKLVRTNGVPGGEAPPGTNTMACHQDQPGTAHAMRLCAGWFAVVGPDHIGVRMMVALGKLPALTPGPDWPPLYSSLEEMLDALRTDADAGSGQRAEVRPG